MSSLRDDARAVSSTVGVALLLGMTVIGTLSVVALGSVAIDDTQRAADHQRMEQSMTQLDSRTAMVALGESDRQSVTLRGDGAVSIDEDAGAMQVWHVNHTREGDHERLYDGTLGAVTYSDGDTTLGYQGGGVWRSGDGGSWMVSPPEVHYRDATLTLPVVQVTGEGASSGRSRATIDRDGTTRHHPNESDDYEASSESYVNPVRNGSVVVVVESEFRGGWERYFDTRTSSTLLAPDEIPEDVRDEAGIPNSSEELRERGMVVARLEAISGGGQSKFRSGTVTEVRGYAPGHAIDDFSTSITINNPTEARISFYASSGGTRFEAVLGLPDGGNNCNWEDGDELTYELLYRDSGDDDKHHWQTTSNVTDESDGLYYTCNEDDQTVLSVDFLEPQATYMNDSDEIAAPNTRYSWDEDTAGSVTVTDENGNTDTVSGGESLPSEQVVGHYLSNFGHDFEVKVDYNRGGAGGNDLEGGGGIDFDDSTVRFSYDVGGSGTYITYLHLTENRVAIRIR